MAERLTDRDRQKIIADYVETENYRETGRLNGVSDTTVRRIVDNEPDVLYKVAQKKEQTTQDMLTFIESRRDKAQLFIDAALEVLPEKLDGASLNQVATALGIVVDKFTKLKEIDLPAVSIKLQGTDGLDE